MQAPLEYKAVSDRISILKNNSKNWLCLFSAVIIGALTACSNVATPLRSTASSEDFSEKIALIKIPYLANETFFLLALDTSDRILKKEQRIDLSAFHWASDDARNIDPKFLIRFQNKLPTQIYSFELGNWNLDRSFGGVPSTRRSHRNRMRAKSPKSYSSLPPVLLNIQSPRQGLVGRLAGDATLGVASFLPLGTVAYMIKHLIRNTELIRKQQAAYLTTMLENLSANSKNSNDAEKYFRSDAINRMTQSLNVRFHPESQYGGLFVEEEMRKDYSEKLKSLQKDRSAENLKKLAKVANEAGLWVYPISANHSLLAYDPSNSNALKHYEDFDVGSQTFAGLPRDLLHLSQQKNKLIPLGIFSNNQTVSSIAVVNFNESLNPALKSRLKKVLDATIDLGFSFIPIPFLSMALKLAGNGVELVLKKNGSIFFESSVQSYGELKAIMDLGIAQLPVEKILPEAVVAHLEEWGFSESETSQISTLLKKSNDEKQTAQILYEVYGRITEKESEASFLVNIQSSEELLNTKLTHLIRFDHWLKKNH